MIISCARRFRQDISRQRFQYFVPSLRRARPRSHSPSRQGFLSRHGSPTRASRTSPHRSTVKSRSRFTLTRCASALFAPTTKLAIPMIIGSTTIRTFSFSPTGPANPRARRSRVRSSCRPRARLSPLRDRRILFSFASQSPRTSAATGASSTLMNQRFDDLLGLHLKEAADLFHRMGARRRYSSASLSATFSLTYSCSPISAFSTFAA